MSTRVDPHRPSAIQPDDYDFVAFEYLRVEDIGSAMFLQMQRERIRAHMAKTGGTYSKHQHGGNCHICGSVNAIYTALFFHRPTNAYVRTGLDCAEKLECSGIEAFRKSVANALEARAGKRKAAAVLEKAGLSKAWELYEARQAELPNEAGYLRELSNEEGTLLDIVGKLIKYGSASPAQIKFMGSLLDRIARAPEIAAQRAAEAAAAKPVPVNGERIKVVGKVLTIRTQEFFPTRMLVQHADGWKVWGTLPAGLEIERGSQIEFSASVKVSDKDPKFGFFSRPTKARVLA